MLRHVHQSGAIVEEIAWVDPEAAFVPLADKPGALWFDSCDATHHAARFSFIAHAPYQTISVADWQAREGFARLDAALRAHGDIWHDLPAEIDACLPPWRGGAGACAGLERAR